LGPRGRRKPAENFKELVQRRRGKKRRQILDQKEKKIHFGRNSNFVLD